MLMPVIIRVLSSLSGIRRLFWFHAYQFLSGHLTESNWLFMNYGWADKDATGEEPEHQLCAQLYARALGATPLTGREILEIGCGRGGGSAWLARTGAPHLVTGVDISPRAIGFCQRFHQADNLQFFTADAEDLYFDDDSFDIVINVESSHCYGDIERFLSEVHRVLRPGGWFCWADMWAQTRVDAMFSKLDRAGLQRVSAADLTDGVLRALESAHPEKERILNTSIPFFLRPVLRPLMGLRGSSLHRRLVSRDIRYFCRTYQKPPLARSE